MSRSRTVLVSGLAALLLAVGAGGASAHAPASARAGGIDRVEGRARAPAASGHDGPTLGSHVSSFASAPERAQAEALVVGVTFAGSAPPAVPLSQFDTVYFGTGSASVASYLKWASYGHFLLRGNVVGAAAAGQSGDWLALPHSLAFYARGDSGMGNPNKPDAIAGGDLLEQTVVGLLDKADFDWRPYEDAAGNVPYLILLVNSPDAAVTGLGSDLWSYEESASDTPIVEGGAHLGVVRNYDMDAAFGEGQGQLNGVGTFDHEFSHILGALDMYDTNNNIAGLANWSLMGTGNYNGPGDDGMEPSDLDAFTRIQFGWSVPTAIAGPPVLYSLPPAETSPEVLEYPIPDSTQYYLMENRQPIGSDNGLPGHGLLIYRVDGTIMNPASRAWDNDCLECISGPDKNPHPGIEIMQSDGTESLAKPDSAGDPGSDGDPFPGDTGNTAFTDSTHPSAKGWGGVPSYLSVTGITQEPNGNILMAAGSVAARLSPSVVGAGGGAVAVSDPLGPFATGDTVTLVGAPRASVTNLVLDGADDATFAVQPDTPPGTYLVEVTGADKVTTALAYLSVTGAGAAGAPARLSLHVPASAAAGQATPVTVRILDAAGTALTGNFGPIWIDGAPAPTTDGVASANVEATRAGSLTVSAALDDLPGVTGTATLQIVPGPVANVRFVGPTSLFAGESATYMIEAEDRFGNPVTGELRLASGQEVALRDGLGQVRLEFTRAGPDRIATALSAPGIASLTVHVQAGAAYRVRSTVRPGNPRVGQTVQIAAVAHDAYGNLAVGDLTLARTTRPLADGRAAFTVRFDTPGEHTLSYRVGAHSAVRVYVRSWFSFPWF